MVLGFPSDWSKSEAHLEMAGRRQVQASRFPASALKVEDRHLGPYETHVRFKMIHVVFAREILRFEPI